MGSPIWKEDDSRRKAVSCMENDVQESKSRPGKQRHVDDQPEDRMPDQRGDGALSQQRHDQSHRAHSDFPVRTSAPYRSL